MDQTSQEFIQQLIGVQPRVRVFIRSLVFDRDRADDLLQQTNVVLVEKAETFKEGTDFGAWACKVAYYEVMADRQKRARHPVVFDNDLVTQLADTADRETKSLDSRQVALRTCLDEMQSKPRDLLQKRYGLNMTITAISRQLNRPVGSVKQALYRIRKALLHCIEGKIKADV